MAEKTLYEILPTVKVPLGRVTVGSVRVLKELGMFNEGADAIDEVTELYLKPTELEDFILAVFSLSEEQKKILTDERTKNNCDGIILEEVVEGYFSFFERLQPNMKRLQDLLVSSMSSALETKTS